jgi:hypothetical protein
MASMLRSARHPDRVVSPPIGATSRLGRAHPGTEPAGQVRNVWPASVHPRDLAVIDPGHYPGTGMAQSLESLHHD